MDQPILSFSSLSQTLMNAPPFTEYETSFGFAPNASTTSSYSESPSGPSSPAASYPHSHPDSTNTGDESSDYLHSSPRTPTTSPKTPKASLSGRRRNSKGSSINCSKTSYSTSSGTTSASGPNSHSNSSSNHPNSNQPPDQLLKRRVQNRAAQRSFRERQKEYVHDLEHQVSLLRDEITRLHENYRDLLKAVTSAPARSGMPGPGQALMWQQAGVGGEVSPPSMDELEYCGSVSSAGAMGGGGGVKMEGGRMWGVPLETEYPGVIYA